MKKRNIKNFNKGVKRLPLLRDQLLLVVAKLAIDLRQLDVKLDIGLDQYDYVKSIMESRGGYVGLNDVLKLNEHKVIRGNLKGALRPIASTINNYLTSYASVRGEALADAHHVSLPERLKNSSICQTPYKNSILGSELLRIRMRYAEKEMENILANK